MTEMGMNARFEITQVIIPGWQSGKNISEVNKMREIPASEAIHTDRTRY